MTTDHLPVRLPSELSSRPRADLRRASRLLAALLLPIGPAAIAILRFVMPYSTTDDSSQIVAKVAAHQTAQSAVVWLGFVGVLTMVPAVTWAARLSRRSAPRLTAVALLLLVPAYTALGLLVAGDAAVLFAVRHHLAPATAADAFEALHPVTLVAGVIFVIGHVVGTVLLGVAYLRTRVVARWAAGALIVAQPLHFVAAVIVSSHPLDLAAWSLNALAFGVAAGAIVRLRDDEWDLAPRPA